MSLTREEFRSLVIARHEAIFDLHNALVVAMERMVNRHRDLSDTVSRSVDMLFIQSFKSLSALGELASVALVEDAAVIVRRLMELGVWSIYLARDSEESIRNERSGFFLASLWESWPSDLRMLIPEDERAAWLKIAELYPTLTTKGKRRRRPTIRQLFEYAEHVDTYEADYSYLSSISHGQPPGLVHAYAHAYVEIHDDREVSRVLLFGVRYALVTFLVWLEHFEIDCPDAARLLSRVKQLRES